MTYDTLLKTIEQLPIPEKWRLVAHILRDLEGNSLAPSAASDDETGQRDWHQALRATYGILADDPIERPPQLPLETREPLE